MNSETSKQLVEKLPRKVHELALMQLCFKNDLSATLKNDILCSCNKNIAWNMIRDASGLFKGQRCQK
jgi:hypothetical protein